MRFYNDFQVKLLTVKSNFHTGFTASRDPYKKHSIVLENLSQSLNIRALSPLKYEEWMEAISMQISGPGT